MWVELPVVFVDKTAEEVERDLDNGVKYDENDMQVDWCCFRKSEIVAFNSSIDPKESTIRLKGDETYRVALTYTELKKIILENE